MKNNINSTKNRLRLSFVLIVAIILLLTIVIVTVLEYAIVLSGISKQEDLEHSGTYWIFVFGLASIVIGLGMAFLLGKLILNPFNTLIDGMARLSGGDFSTRIFFGNKKYLSNLSDSFNSLAIELENTEILRSDFVNNFSHELKTPIASVSSLISLLKNDNLPKMKRDKYLSIIEEEMDRLSSMTTNILNLSKIEKQEILTEKTEFNISEQIRKCVLLLEKKWTKKHLELSLDFDEILIFANEDMLKQVWFNLLDNAIKFANYGGILSIRIVSDDINVKVYVENSGSSINENEKLKIFNKFYRSQNAPINEGNGIGLSIVSHIVKLHSGEIDVESENNITTFIVTLPARQD